MDEIAIMNLVVNSGNARSLALEAFRDARAGKFEDAEAKLKEADEVLLGAHEVQTELIQNELNGKGIDISLLVVHSQDHLMCAMVVIDLVKEMVEMLNTIGTVQVLERKYNTFRGSRNLNNRSKYVTEYLYVVKKGE